jgi:predicted NBD/HSP70 family sugar kinase
MTQRIIFGLMSGHNTIIADLVNNDFNRIDIGIIREALDKEDSLVCEVVEETAKRLAFGVNNIINTINPDTVIIGGEIIRLGDVFLGKIRGFVREIGFGHYTEKVIIRYSGIGEAAVTLGAAKYVLDNIFKINWYKGDISK